MIGVEKNASKRLITRKCALLIQKYHLSTNTGNSIKLRRKRAVIYDQLERAEKVLSSKKFRNIYDMQGEEGLSAYEEMEKNQAYQSSSEEDTKGKKGKSNEKDSSSDVTDPFCCNRCGAGR